MIILNEENNTLKGKMFPIFDGLRKHLKKTLSDYEERNGDKNNNGYDRLVWICSQDSISMEEMKRIKNFFFLLEAIFCLGLASFYIYNIYF